MRRRVATLVALALLSSTSLMAGDLPAEGEVVTPHQPGQTSPRSIPTWESTDEELESHLPNFIRIGYQEIPWVTWGPEREHVLRNLLGGDYKRRTGNELPDDPSFDFALVNLTGGDFNDVIVSSHLPGDCIPSGCLITIFKMVAKDEWKPVSSFHALAVAHRRGPDDDSAKIVAVGDDVFPSILMQWDGKTFQER